MHNLFRRLDGWLFALLLLVAAGALGYLSTRYAHESDWTAKGPPGRGGLPAALSARQA